MRKVIITDKGIEIEGFNNTVFHEPGLSGRDLGDCRDVARVAIVWALKKLAEDLELDMYGQWDHQKSCLND